MWIFCCGMIRSGSTLQYQIASELVEELAVGRRMGGVNENIFNSLLKSHKETRDLAVIKCHWFFDKAGELIKEGEAKGIYIYRDIRDVVVSMMKHTDRSFTRLLMGRLVEKVLRSYRQWQGSGKILVSRYEDMVLDRSGEVMRIANHMGLTIDKPMADTIADKYSIEKQKERIRNLDYQSIYRRHKRRNAPDEHSFLKSNHIQSGKTGEWRSALKWYESAMIEQIAHRWLVENGYPISQSWTRRQLMGALYYLILRPAGFLGQTMIKVLKFIRIRLWK